MGITDRLASASYIVESSDLAREGIGLAGTAKDDLHFARSYRVLSPGTTRSIGESTSRAIDQTTRLVARQEYTQQIATLPEDEWGAGPSWVNPYTYVKSFFAQSALIDRFEGRHDSAAYKDYVWSRRIGLLNFVVSLEPGAVVTGYILLIAEKIAAYFNGMSVASFFGDMSSKFATFANSAFGQGLAKAMPWVLIANGIIQLKRKLGIYSEINEFLRNNGSLKDTLSAHEKTNAKEFLNNLKEEYFTLSFKEKADIIASNKLTQSEIREIETKARGNPQTYNKLKILKENEKNEIAKARQIGDKLHKLSRLVGKEATKALAEGGLDTLIKNADDPDKFEKVFAGAQKIIERAKMKRTAERIDILVQCIFTVVGIAMLFGSSFTGLMIVGLVLWGGLVIYTKWNLGKIDFREGIDLPSKGNTKTSIYGGYSPELLEVFAHL